MKLKLLAAAAALFILPMNAEAQEGAFDLQTLQQGEVLINLSASERTEVSQDTLIARLDYQVEAESRKEVQAEINEAVKAALDLARDVTEVEHSTQGYNVYQRYEHRPVDNKQGEKERKTWWQGSQTIVLESENSDALLTLAGKLQGMDFTMSGLNYSLSSEKYEETSDALLEGALKKLQARAETAQKALGKSSAELIRINLDGSQPMYQPKMMMARMDSMAESSAAMPAPEAAPGMTEVSLTVSATALLKP